MAFVPWWRLSLCYLLRLPLFGAILDGVVLGFGATLTEFLSYLEWRSVWFLCLVMCCETCDGRRSRILPRLGIPALRGQ